MAKKKIDDKAERPKNVDHVNRFMAMPKSVHTDDGRELIIVTWQPMYHLLEATIKVRMEVVISDPLRESRHPKPAEDEVKS